MSDSGFAAAGAALTTENPLPGRLTAEEMAQQLAANHARLWRWARYFARGNRELAEDILQEATVLAMHSAEQFDPSKGALTTWLGWKFRGAAEVVRRKSRGRGEVSWPTRSSDDGDEQPFEIPTDATQNDCIDLAEALGALAEVPRRERDILMAYARGETFAEIAERYKLSPDWVRDLRDRARAQLVNEMAKPHETKPDIQITQTAEKRSLVVPDKPPVDHGAGGPRRIRPIKLRGDVQPSAEAHAMIPEIKLICPADLYVEGAYQRDLSAASQTLIKKIITGWEWSKFKPPIVAERGGAYVVIDGQHTAIAAATLGIEQIPVLFVRAAKIQKRADSFVSHNRDRLAMSQFQLFHASVTAGDPVAMAVYTAAVKTGAIIPRAAPGRGKGKPGQIIGLRDIQRYAKQDIGLVERIFRIAVAAEAAPLGVTATRSLHLLLTEPHFADVGAMPDTRIANALKNIAEFETTARAKGEETGHGQVRAGAVMIAEACHLPEEAQAAA